MAQELIDYVGRELLAMHRLYDRVTADLDDAQVNAVPDGGKQNIAFSLWHYVRTEDNVINFVVRRQPTVWLAGGWPAAFGLDAKSQGTGFTDDEAKAFRIEGIGEFRRYMADVFASTRRFVETLTPADVGRAVTVKPLGEMSVLDCLSGMCMTHGYRHLGEIEFAKGLVAPRGGSTI
ncbi:MAG: DinB family protein [Dehalococcoidia bacterium]|nr:DinB family protein [Dehalococcoidia bacterium]